MIPTAASSRGARKKANPMFSVMWRCVVSGCPNRMGSLTRAGGSNFSRTSKRFFSFPKTPDRVKVWLAALRETDKDPSEQHFICEDHFLPEDVRGKEVRGDAIPIMPLYLDGSQGAADPFQEEEQWSGGWEEEEEEAAEVPSEADVKRESRPEDETGWLVREGAPLSRVTRGFLELLMADPHGAVDVREAAAKLQSHAHRVRAVVDVLRGIGLVQTEDDRVSWIGSSPIFSFLWRDTLAFLAALQRLKAMEDQLDHVFKTCAQQLFSLTEDQDDSALAYVRCGDICRLPGLQQQTVIAIRSPPETRLVIPPPEEDGIRMQLKSDNGPISALTCDVGPLTSEVTNGGRVFSALEGRIRAVTITEVVGSKRMKI